MKVLRLAGMAASLLVVVLLASSGTVGHAHPLAPALFEITEGDDGRAHVRWKVSRLQPRGVELRPILPEVCEEAPDAAATEDAQSVTFSWSVDCGASSLVGKEISVEGLAQAKIDVLARVKLRDGRVVSEILTGRKPALTIPERQSKSQVANNYLRLGTEHILTGLDHLLFVLGLLLLVSTTRSLVRTITAFTLGHSITLSIVALDWATVPAGPVELLISVSVLVLAVELAQQQDAKSIPSLLRRRPWLMALLFGLLHGMGFAGALAEVGLPQEEIPLALLSFNIGIEIGQLAFVLALLGVWRVVGTRVQHVPRWLAQLPAYGIGSLAAYWCIERGAALVQ
jgi:hydrogenase/urease accessory protein HupE